MVTRRPTDLDHPIAVKEDGVTTVEAGQFWALWVYDSYRERMLVERVDGDTVYATTINGGTAVVGRERLESEGKLVDPPLFYGRHLESSPAGAEE